MAGPGRRDHIAGDGLEHGWRLEGSDGDGGPVNLQLGETRLRRAYPGLAIGRHRALCELILDDPTVSLRHFRVSIDGDRLMVEDLNSLNGTLLDRRELRPFEPEELAAGAVLIAGEVSLTLVRVAD